MRGRVRAGAGRLALAMGGMAAAGRLVLAMGGMAAAAGAAGAQPSETADAAECSSLDSLVRVLERHARLARGPVGVTAIHVESGLRLSVGGERRFPMASVYKVPIALQYLHRVDRGELRLTDTVTLTPADFRPGHSPLAVAARNRSIALTADSLLRLMISHSDNTATDVILRLAGGPEAVNARLRELGVTGMDVQRSEARTFADLWGIPESFPESELSRRSTFQLRERIPSEERRAARARYGEDPRDTSTPEAMADLLEGLLRGEGLQPESHALLLSLLADTPTGARRLRGLLPPETPVAHKTGTMGGAINDVGIVHLPDGDHLVVAAFVNSLAASVARRERAIALISRSLYDFFAAPPGADEGPEWLAAGASCGPAPAAVGATGT